MATKNLRFGSITPAALRLGSSEIRRCYLGVDMVWDEPMFVDDPKIDPLHDLANRSTLLYLQDGDRTGMTVVSGTAQVVDQAYASNTPGTLAMHRAAFPAANSRTFRVSALIKVDKTAGRYSRIGFASNSATPNASSPDIYIGHDAGNGIRVSSVNFAISLNHTVLSEAQCVNGAWYRVTLVYDNVFDYDTSDTSTGRARVHGTAEPVDPVNAPAEPWYPVGNNSRHDSVAPTAYVPQALIVRTNSALGTVRDLYYIDTMLGATANGTVNGGDPVDNAPMNYQAKMTGSSDRFYLWSKGKTAPLRVILTAGGTGVYGGVGPWGQGAQAAGHPYSAFRKMWRDLAELGYTVLHTDALHEGWGADDHLTKQLAALNQLEAEFGAVRLYYLAYSMGGVSAWRAIRGRAGFPTIRAAYLVAGISRLDPYYDQPLYSQIQTRWPVRANLDEPQSWAAADLTSRGTRVRMITSTADTNVPKDLEHDPMAAKYSSNPELFSERVLNVTHFDPSYWDAQDCVDFFEGADL